MAGKIKEIINTIIQERSKGNPAIAEMTKAKFILKGINPDKFYSNTEDDPVIINKLLTISKQLNENNFEGERSNIKSVFSIKSDENEAVEDIKRQLIGFGVKILIFFASSSFDHERLSRQMHEVFNDCIVFGCSTAGELVNTKLLKNSIVAMCFNSNIISDAKVEVVENLNCNLSVDKAFSSFESYFNENPYTMDTTRYVGVVLIDGVSMKEEKLMDQIGNRTNVFFVGGSAGDDLKFKETYTCANGRVYTDAAVLALIKVNDHAEFGIVKTQSFKALDRVLIANKVNEETREVIEFNNKPAIVAYAEAVEAASVEAASEYFVTNPIGLIIGDDVFVRSPRQRIGTSINFYCNILEGSEVRLLESTNIIEDTKAALEKKISEFGSIEGIINFHCIERTLELEKKNLVQQYGEIFNNIPTVGFSTYGEEYIGHINQTSTMLVFKSGRTDFSKQWGNTLPLETYEKQRHLELINEELIRKNDELQKIVQDRNNQLEETTSALKEFNIVLEDEITERTKKEEEISYLSYHDTLTGLYNRRFYEEEIKRLDTKDNLPISIIMGDVNGLKAINDAFGHEIGDELLVKVATGIQNACRKDDIAARWGGDEFIILLPKTQSDDVQKIVNRMNKGFSKEYVGNSRVSVSFGWDTKNNPNEDILQVLKRAEDLMYEQKAIGYSVVSGHAINGIHTTLYEKGQKEKRHSNRVGELCVLIGSAIGLSEIEISKLKAVGILHDIGKIVIEDNVLNKRGELTEQEWNEIKLHPDTGYRILTSSFDMLELASGVLTHHERWDGTGYPRGLKGEEIPKIGRIIAIADSYDVMTSERPYRNALSKEEALTEIKKNAGTQFDPEIAKIFIDTVLNENE